MSGTADRRLWYTADRSELVEDGDIRAAILAAAPGDPIPDLDIADAPESDEEAVSGLTITKEADKPEDKAQDVPEDDKGDEEHVCDVCGKVAKSAGGLAAHQRSHDDD